jgi:regulator of RNase E activity RraA
MTERGSLSEATRDKLMGVSVATLCSALYKRGLRNQVIQDVRPVRPTGRNMVGPAFTLRYMPAREDRNEMSVFRNPDHPQRRAVETCPPGFILVMDSRKDPRAASAGDILVTRLMMRGAAGVVTDGGFRDAMRIAELDIPTTTTGRRARPT